MKVGSRPSNPTALSPSSFKSLLLGRSLWTISGDSKYLILLQTVDNLEYIMYKGCYKGLPYNQTLKLTGCLENEFTCDDGQCIDISKRCNQIINCRDKSDEMRCQLLVLDYGYTSRVPPFTLVRALSYLFN